MLCHGQYYQINYIISKEEMGKILQDVNKNIDFYFKMKSYIPQSRTKYK